MNLKPHPTAPTKKLEPHQYSTIMPQQSKEELENLASDISKNGVLHPIVLYKGKILDGVHRYNILAGFNFQKPHGFVEFDGTDAEAKLFVISANIHRRHIRPEDRRAIIASVIMADPTQSNRSIAETTKTSHHTVQDVRSELEATGQTAQLDATTGKDGKTRKTKTKTQDGPKSVAAVKTACTQRLEALVDALGDLQEVSGFDLAEEYAIKAKERIDQKVKQMMEEELAKEEVKAVA